MNSTENSVVPSILSVHSKEPHTRNDRVTWASAPGLGMPPIIVPHSDSKLDSFIPVYPVPESVVVRMTM